MRRVASEKTACCCTHIAKSKGLGTPLVSVAGWRVSSSGTQTDSDGGVVTLVTVGDGPTCPGQSCSVRPPERSRAQPRQQHRTLVVPHLYLVKPISMYQMRLCSVAVYLISDFIRKTSLPYFRVKLSCVCLMFAYRRK